MCGGRLECFHPIPASLTRRRKGNMVSGGYNCASLSLEDIQGPGPPGGRGGGVDARLTTLLYKKLLLQNPKKWKPDLA